MALHVILNVLSFLQLIVLMENVDHKTDGHLEVTNRETEDLGYFYLSECCK